MFRTSNIKPTMNTSTLTKCVTELQKETPNIPYILGMLETFIELSTPMKIAGITPPVMAIDVPDGITKEIFNEELTDEQKATAERYARAGVVPIS